MQSSLRIVPESQPKVASINDTKGTLGLHDTLRYGPRNLTAEINNQDAFKSRLENWEQTQDNLKLTLQRNTFGMAAPLRLMMERKIVSSNPHMPAIAQSNIHLDILMGRDESIEPADFFGGLETGPSLDIHHDMERKARMIK